MASDGFVTDKVFLASLIAYLYSWDSVLKIEASGPRFTFDAPSEDCKLLEEELNKGETTVLLNQYINTYTRMTGILKKLNRTGESTYVSSSWINGKTSSGRKIA
jgi:hypothetical protein